jgi:hypothetical protein
MYKSIKPIAAAAGIAAVLTAGLSVATHASDYSTGTYSSKGGSAGETITMSTQSTTLETASFGPAAKAAAPCGFAQTGAC